MAWLNSFRFYYCEKTVAIQYLRSSHLKLDALLSLAFLKGYREQISSYNTTFTYLKQLKMNLTGEMQKEKFIIWRTHLSQILWITFPTEELSHCRIRKKYYSEVIAGSEKKTEKK